MGIEITLDESEKKILWLLSQTGSIRLEGLTDLMYCLDSIGSDRIALRYFLALRIPRWLEYGWDTILSKPVLVVTMV